MTIYVECFQEQNFNFPGSEDNPMLPLMYKHPVTGEIHQAHYNSRNLQWNEDYEAAGFVYIAGHGWCYPIQITEKERQSLKTWYGTIADIID